MKENDFNSYFPTWCPGCGDFGIWASLKQSFVNLGWTPDSFVIVYGIGCSGNMNDFIKSYGFHSLHGRAIPNAVGIRLANHTLPVIVVSGDGDLLGEGGNHFLHACRGNFDITVVIHDNRVYGLTTGQAAPTAQKGYKSKSTPAGIIETPINPVSLAITQGATFVAQGFAGDIQHLTDLIVKGVKHKGFSVINVFQPCITFNKINTHEWYRKHIYQLDKAYDVTNAKDALEKAMEVEKLPLGVLYNIEKPTYEESVPQIKDQTLVDRTKVNNIEKLLKEFT